MGRQMESDRAVAVVTPGREAAVDRRASWQGEKQERVKGEERFGKNGSKFWKAVSACVGAAA